MRILISFLLCAGAAAAELPARYYQLLESGMAQVRQGLAATPGATLEKLEQRPGWRHFPSAILAAAVLHRKSHDPVMLKTALEIGDLLVVEQANGKYNTRLDHHRDTYMWLEAYRLLEPQLGDARREKWKRALTENLEPLAEDVARRQDYAWYASPFIGTSPNHYSLWSSTLYLAGRVFHRPEWEKLGARVMHRFASEEQSPDGYWGEHSRAGPTTGYDYLTATAVAVYWEHSGDGAALDALRRSTNFHEYFTYPNGTPVETVNDRNRYWEVSAWGHFGFSSFGDGRRYAEFLTAHLPADRLSLEMLGRLAQDALYFHEGPLEPIPQDRANYAHRMAVPAGIRKSGPWVVCLSGILSTPTLSQFYLDRQANLSVFHEKAGLIVTGANSKRQPELATFQEKVRGELIHLPMSSRLAMGDAGDRLSLAFNSFFAVLEALPPSSEEASFRLTTTPKGRTGEATFTLQLYLKPGEPLETAVGKRIVPGQERVELGAEEIGGWIRHNGWTLKADAKARLVWPVRPFSPYANAPEAGLEHAVAAFSVSLQPGVMNFSVGYRQ